MINFMINVVGFSFNFSEDCYQEDLIKDKLTATTIYSDKSYSRFLVIHTNTLITLKGKTINHDKKKNTKIISKDKWRIFVTK